VSDYLDVRLHFVWAVLSPRAEQRFTGKKLKRCRSQSLKTQRRR